jgi:hypothetical protein
LFRSGYRSLNAWHQAQRRYQGKDNVQHPHSGKAWSETDLTDLGRSVGIPIDHIAKFLMRDLKDVAEKADSLEAFGFDLTCSHPSS